MMKKLDFRCRPASVRAVLNGFRHNITPEVEVLLTRCNVYHFLELPPFPQNLPLITELLYCWRPEDETFLINGASIPFTAEQVALIVGMPNRGRYVKVYDNGPTHKNDANDFRKEMKSYDSGRSAQQFATLFIEYLISNLFFITHNYKIPAAFINYASNLDEFPNYNWPQAIHSFLVRQMNSFSSRISNNKLSGYLQGFVTVLLIWFLEHSNVHNAEFPERQPRMMRWSHEISLKAEQAHSEFAEFPHTLPSIPHLAEEQPQQFPSQSPYREPHTLPSIPQEIAEEQPQHFPSPRTVSLLGEQTSVSPSLHSPHTSPFIPQHQSSSGPESHVFSEKHEINILKAMDNYKKEIFEAMEIFKKEIMTQVNDLKSKVINLDESVMDLKSKIVRVEEIFDQSKADETIRETLEMIKEYEGNEKGDEVDSRLENLSRVCFEFVSQTHGKQKDEEEGENMQIDAAEFEKEEEKEEVEREKEEKEEEEKEVEKEEVEKEEVKEEVEKEEEKEEVETEKEVDIVSTIAEAVKKRRKSTRVKKVVKTPFTTGLYKKRTFVHLSDEDDIPISNLLPTVSNKKGEPKPKEIHKKQKIAILGEKDVSPDILNVLHNCLNKYEDKNDIVFMAGNVIIARTQIDDLVTNCWLGNGHIDALSIILNDKTPEYFHPFLFISSSYYHYFSLGKDASNLVSHITKDQLKMAKYLVMPLYRSQHWTLGIGFIKEERWKFYDSLPNEMHNDLLPLCIKLLHEDRGSEFSSDITMWPVEIVEEAPRQQNGFDCGMYVVKNIEAILRKSETEFNWQEDTSDWDKRMPEFRIRFAVDIINHARKRKMIDF